jgi:prepilin-type N-terminal cleavage/methylation domain-containing protein
VRFRRCVPGGRPSRRRRARGAPLVRRLPPGSSGGFTLIEMLAVVAMFALIAGLVLPTLNFGGNRAVRGEASDLAAALEFARQRAVMTGRTHQVVIDIEHNAHWVEWAPPRDPGGTPAADAAGNDGAGGAAAPLDLVPPAVAVDRFEPVPDQFGRPHVADDRVAILGVRLPEGLRDAGTVALRFTPDGTADSGAILFGDPGGPPTVEVDVEPLADAVQVVDVQ